MLPPDWPQVAGIYKIFFLDSTLFYIGSAANLRIRWSLHQRQLQKGTHHNIHLQRAYDKYGSDSLHLEVVEYVERKEDLIVREQYYLDTLQPHFNIFKNARNMLGLKHTEAAKARISAVKKGNSPAPNKGKPMSETQKQYFRDHYTGKPHGHRTNNGRPSANRGKSPSPETIAKMLATRARKGIKSIPPKCTPASQEKRRMTMRNMSPERKADMWTKRNATKAANRLANPPKWSSKYDACIACGTTKSRYCGNGLCQACYKRDKRSKRAT